ncbi:MAG: tRNA (adenosine(37)-N6)-threonylcarbamoyltransferase complex ATPase subunit type 1 TsaE [Sandaracinaceae bacterium]|nr:MAG: tRNA (adenosine(37)-N6)-threonylcarbamoyltransferase complex ATPase subunit type 1 TsaE [Sandaracinaceae bacterium]
MLRLELDSRRATRKLGAALASLLEVGDVVWLEGALGAGKTFFTRGLFRALGVPEEVPVTSPTFALLHEHEGRVPLAHLDLYRLSSVDELVELGLFEVMERSVTVIEWGARFREGIGARGVALTLSRRAGEERGRDAVIEGLDPRGEALVARLRDAWPRSPAARGEG